MISFTNRDELVKFLEDCREATFEGGAELTSAELVDRLIAEMEESGEITAYGIQAERYLKNAANAVGILGETEGTAIISALTGVGFALMHNGLNAESFYAAMIAARDADAG